MTEQMAETVPNRRTNLPPACEDPRKLKQQRDERPRDSTNCRRRNRATSLQATWEVMRESMILLLIGAGVSCLFLGELRDRGNWNAFRPPTR